MIITVGSTNIIKVEAAKESIRNYPLLANAEIISLSVPSDISEQPLTLAETIQGAKNRAKNAFNLKPCTYSFGIESGLIEALGTQSGYIEACICAIYSGKDYHIGLSCGFEVPPKVLSRVLTDKMTLNDACHHSGLTANPKLGSSTGLIGLLTNNLTTRKEYTKQAIAMALIQIDNADLYRPTFSQ